MVNKGQKLLLAAPALVLAEGVSAIAHGGGLGAIVALGAAGLAYAYADEISAVLGRGEDSPAPARSVSGKQFKKAGYRLLVGKSERGNQAPDDSSEWDDSWYDDDDLLPPSMGKGQMFTFSQVLASGFVPSLSALYLGKDSYGHTITVAAKDLCHVALPGATGNGKSSIMRLLMAQLCYLGIPVLLLNPHYMRYNHESGEDWTPFEPLLQRSALGCADFGNIKILLQWMAENLLKKRIEQRANGGKPGKPYFIFIDEWPSIVGELGKDAPKYLGKILREGRKYGIYVVIASQDFSVKTLGVDGEGGIRKCFLTAFYVGGDPVGGKELLNMSANEIPENQLGKGTVMLRYRVWLSPTTSEMRTIMAHVPFTDNEALYRLLGPSTFTYNDAEVQEDDPLAPNYNERDYASEADDMHTESLLSADLNIALEYWNAGEIGPRAIQRATGWTYYKAQQVCNELVEKGLVQAD